MAGKQVEADTPTSFPDKAEPQKVIEPDAKSMGIGVKLSEEDKLAEGKSLTISTFVSPDNGKTWEFVNGSTWESYGPKGYTMYDFDGTEIVNPDPRINLPRNTKRGGAVKVVVEPSHSITVDAEFASR